MFNGVPTELWLEILKNFPTTAGPAKRPRSLVSLYATCSYFRELVEPLFFRDLHLRGPELEHGSAWNSRNLLSRTERGGHDPVYAAHVFSRLSEDETLARAVRTIKLVQWKTSNLVAAGDWEHVYEALTALSIRLPQLPALHTLVLREVEIPPHLHESLYRCTKLKEVSFHSCHMMPLVGAGEEMQPLSLAKFQLVGSLRGTSTTEVDAFSAIFRAELLETVSLGGEACSRFMATVLDASESLPLKQAQLTLCDLHQAVEVLQLSPEMREFVAVSGGGNPRDLKLYLAPEAAPHLSILGGSYELALVGLPGRCVEKLVVDPDEILSTSDFGQLLTAASRAAQPLKKLAVTVSRLTFKHFELLRQYCPAIEAIEIKSDELPRNVSDLARLLRSITRTFADNVFNNLLSLTLQCDSGLSEPSMLVQTERNLVEAWSRGCPSLRQITLSIYRGWNLPPSGTWVMGPPDCGSTLQAGIQTLW